MAKKSSGNQPNPPTEHGQLTAHPRLAVLSAVVYGVWLVYLAYVAWQSQA